MDFSFASIKAALVQRLSLLTSWSTQILQLGVYSRILDVIAYGLAQLGFYLEYLYKNTFLKTAEDNAAVVVKAWELGYKAHRKKGASGRVKLSADPGFSVALATYTGPTIEIPRWTTFTDTDRQQVVYSTEDAIYYTGTVIGHRTLIALDIPVNLGNSKVGFNVLAHGYPVGQIVTIKGTANYDGDYLIDAATTTDQIVIVFPNTFVLETFDGTEKIFTGHLHLPVKEGRPKEFTYVANGSVNEKFTIFSDKADNDEVEMFVVDLNGNILYTVTITEDIYLINSTTFYNCSIESLPSFAGFTVQFGDGVTSRKLAPDERILVKYADTKATAGNVENTGVITEFFEPIQDLSGNEASIYVTNDEFISGAAEYEDIEDTRHFSRNLFQAGYRAHSENDYITILDDHPLIQKSTVWNDYDVNQSLVGMTNSIVHISAVTIRGDELTTAEQADIKINYLKQKRSVTDIIQFEPLKLVNAQFRIDAKLKPVPYNTVVQNVYNALVAKYGILNTSYKTDIYESGAIETISAADDNIIFHHTEIWHVERSEDYPEITPTVGSRAIIVSLTAGVEANPLKQIYILNKAVEIWIRRKISGVLQDPKRIGYVNPSLATQIIGDNGYTVTGGVVNYTTNQVTFNLQDIILDVPVDGGSTYGVQNPGDIDVDGYFLRIAYQTRNGVNELINDIRLPYFFNITDVELEDVEKFFTFTY